jgi:hypothetical protein
MAQSSERAWKAMLDGRADEAARRDVDDDIYHYHLSLHWTVAMMELAFARRPELERYAWRIQGAA